MSHTLLTRTPRQELRAFIRCFAYREMCLGDSVYSQTDAASLEHILAFDLRDRVMLNYFKGQSKVGYPVQLVGSQSSETNIGHFTGHVLQFGVFLKPFACWQLFRIPPAEFAEREFDAGTVFGRQVHELWIRLAEPQTFSERIRIAEEYLIPLAHNAVPLTPTMRTAQFLIQSYPQSVRQIALSASMSVRSYERTFSAEIGISPKRFSRIARFQRAVDEKRVSGDSWLTVAQEAGYFDQMHMVRDFRSLCGRAPTRLIDTFGDFQPWSLGQPG